MKVADIVYSKSGLPHRVLSNMYNLYLGAWYTFTTRWPIGTNIFERDWDVLVLLDACRVDAMRSVAAEYDFIDEVNTMRSVGSHSFEWMAKTFTTEHRDTIEKTAYLTANPHTQRLFLDHERPPKFGTVSGWPNWDIVDKDTFERLELTWKDGHDTDLGNTPPRVMTDRLIDVARNGTADRIIVHYMQPHLPYMAEAVTEGRPTTDVERDPLNALRQGVLTYDQAWKMYLDNLRLALDEIAILRNNVDAEKLIITTDHGESFGELGDIDHREGNIHPVVKTVPWVATTATDERTYEPTVSAETSEREETSVEEQLRDLGYR